MRNSPAQSPRSSRRELSASVAKSCRRRVHLASRMCTVCVPTPGTTFRPSVHRESAAVPIAMAVLSRSEIFARACVCIKTSLDGKGGEPARVKKPKHPPEATATLPPGITGAERWLTKATAPHGPNALRWRLRGFPLVQYAFEKPVNLSLRIFALQI